MSQDISTETLDALVAHAYEAASDGILLALPDADRMARHELHAALLELKRRREQNWWIANRYPKDDANVLAFANGDCVEAYCEGSTWYGPHHEVLHGVTHWMPLPAAPKES